MEPDLNSIALRTRFMREAGIAIVLASLVLGVFLFIPLAPQRHEAATVATASAPSAFDAVVIEAKAAIVYDLATGHILYEKNADAQLPLASLTKLLTVEAAVRSLAPGVPIDIQNEDEAVESPHRFAVGDTITFEDLARLTLTASLNDGAAAIARTVAERESTTTVAMLQNAASALGLESTYAVNGNGLDVSGEVSGGYGSARDIAVLSGALVQDAPEIALATTLAKASAATEKGKHYEISNTNPTVTNAPRLLLSKTGFTDLAGGNLSVVFDAGINHPVAVVVLGSTEEARFTDATTLTAAALAEFAGLASL